MIRSESTSAFGQPSETKETRGAALEGEDAGWVIRFAWHGGGRQARRAVAAVADRGRVRNRTGGDEGAFAATKSLSVMVGCLATAPRSRSALRNAVAVRSATDYPCRRRPREVFFAASGTPTSPRLDLDRFPDLFHHELHRESKSGSRESGHPRRP